MIDNNVFVMFVSLATLCTIIIIGLGFLPRPSRAAAIWSAAFALAMGAAYVWLAGNSLSILPLRSAAAGFVMAASALIWVGLRARRGADRIYLVPTEIVFLAVAVVLFTSAEASWGEIAFRGALAITAVFAAATTQELFRMGPLHRDEVLPLALASLAFIVLTAVSLVDAVLRLTRGESLAVDEGILELRTLGVLGSGVYFVAALVTLILLVREAPTDTARAVRLDFDTIARERLSRAERASDLWWSVLEVRLDDPVAIREASSTAAYNRVVAQFGDHVRSVFPAEADLHRQSATSYLVLLPRPEAAVRPLMAALLQRVATKGSDPGIDIRLSASIGWAPAGLIGYSLDDLMLAASDAVAEAQRAGGDRWERADAAAWFARRASEPIDPRHTPDTSPA